MWIGFRGKANHRGIVGEGGNSDGHVSRRRTLSVRVFVFRQSHLALRVPFCCHSAGQPNNLENYEWQVDGGGQQCR